MQSREENMQSRQENMQSREENMQRREIKIKFVFLWVVRRLSWSSSPTPFNFHVILQDTHTINAAIKQFHCTIYEGRQIAPSGRLRSLTKMQSREQNIQSIEEKDEQDK